MLQGCVCLWEGGAAAILRLIAAGFSGEGVDRRRYLTGVCWRCPFCVCLCAHY